MVAGAAEMAVVCGAFLVAMDRAFGTVDIEDQRRRSALRLNPVDPVPVQTRQRREVALVGQNSDLKTVRRLVSAPSRAPLTSRPSK